MECEFEMVDGKPVCKTHSKPLVCPSANASKGNKAMRKRFSKKQRTEWARKGGKLGGRPKQKAA